MHSFSFIPISENNHRLTLSSLQDADLQALEGFTGQFFQRAQRRGLTEQRPVGQTVAHRRKLLPGGEEVCCPSAQGVASPHSRLAEDVLDAEGRQRLVGVGRWRELIQRAAPPLLKHRWTFRVVLRGHGGLSGWFSRQLLESRRRRVEKFPREGRQQTTARITGASAAACQPPSCGLQGHF